MKIGDHDLTLKNIHAYLQGNLRFLAEQYGVNFIKMDTHIREQVMFRMDIAKPECLEKKECTECHCSIPELMYADKQCGGECYPAMMNKEQWQEFKNAIRAHTLENGIEKIDYPFTWQNIMNLINGNVIVDKTDIIIGTGTTAIASIYIDMGTFAVGNIISHTFTLHNHNDVNVFIKDTNISCGCTTTEEIINKIIKANKNLDILIDVKTEGKRTGEHVFIVELIFNNNTSTKLTMKCILI